MKLNKSHISLTVGRPFRLTADEPVITWSSDNPRIKVSRTGLVRADVDALRPYGQGKITATNESGSAECEVTIVDWSANRLSLQTVAQLRGYVLTKAADGSVYASYNTDLYHSSDGLVTLEPLPDLPVTNYNAIPMLVTPFGYFMRPQGKVYRSPDLQNWTLSCDFGTLGGLYHSFDWDYDEATETGYIYFGEYTADAGTGDRRHKVFRGVFHGQDETWSTILDFYSRNEYTADPVTNTPSAKHVHIVIVDRSIHQLWVGTGDLDHECRMMYSDDHGDTFRILGEGSQKWRTLSIWFTTRYVYWNMDSEVKASIWRIPRSVYDTNGFWPTITAENDYTEKVIDLFNGSLWYHCWAKDDLGDDIVIMNTTAEGQWRDWRARVFSIKELPDASVEVEELISVAAADPSVYNPFHQLTVRLQDANGYIYFKGRELPWSGLYKMRLSRLPPVREIVPDDYQFVTPTAFVMPAL